MIRVLLADRMPVGAVAQLEAAGATVIDEPALAGDALISALATHRPDVLVVRSTKVTAEALDAATCLALIVRAGAGTNTIDVQGAAMRGIFVANCPGKNAAAVAELTFGLMLAADRQIPNNVRDLRAGRWDKQKYAGARGLMGRTLGLLGLGNIGRAVAERAKAFGMPVLAWSRNLTDEDARALGVTRAPSALAVASAADIVSVHVALTPETTGLVDRAFVEAMKPGAMLINTSRGGVLDEAAVAWGVAERGLRVGLDVYGVEPASGEAHFENPLVANEQVFGTHHIGASTAQAQEAVAMEAVRVITTYARSGDVPNCVNLCERSPATHLLVVRHLDQVGVLAGVFARLRAAEINVQETQNTIFEGAHAAVARLWLDREPDETLHEALRGCEGVLALSSVPLP